MPEAGPPSSAGKPRLLRWGIPAAALLCAGAVLVVYACPRQLAASRRNPARDLVPTIHAYVKAQGVYHGKDRDGDGKQAYAHPYWELSKIAAELGQQPLLDDKFFAAQGPGGAPKYGHLFQDMETIAGQKIDWTKDFALCATPARYGKWGYRTCIVMTSGTVWSKDLNKSEFVTDFPADPMSEGWIPGD